MFGSGYVIFFHNLDHFQIIIIRLAVESVYYMICPEMPTAYFQTSAESQGGVTYFGGKLYLPSFTYMRSQTQFSIGTSKYVLPGA